MSLLRAALAYLFPDEQDCAPLNRLEAERQYLIARNTYGEGSPEECAAFRAMCRADMTAPVLDRRAA